MEKKLDIEDIVLIGRTFDEYYSMFNVEKVSKEEKILDVGSGVSSFCAEATALGYDVTASDRIYCFSPEEIERKCKKDLEITMEKLEPIKDLYKWEFFRDTEELKKQREKAYKTFIEDFKGNSRKRYVNTEYPESNFKDNQFTIAFVSHFLFMYDEFLDYEFHKKVIRELIRITSKEIRIFPIVNLKGKESSFVNKLLKDVEFSEYTIEVENTKYEFVKGGDKLLSIKII